MRKRTDAGGFTLMELLLVLAIIGILVAIAVAVFAAQITRASAAVDRANVRNAKAAAVTAYLTDPTDRATYYFDADSGTVTTDKTAAAAFTGYGKSTAAVEGSTGIPLKNGRAQIVAVTVKNDGTETAAWGLGTELDTFAAQAAAQEAAFNGPSHTGDALIEAMGELPSVAVSELFGSESISGGGNTLYWRPKVVTVNGTKTIFLYANTSSTGYAGWNGYAVYYQGATYVSEVRHPSTHKIDGASVLFPDIEGDLETYLLGTNRWRKLG